MACALPCYRITSLKTIHLSNDSYRSFLFTQPACFSLVRLNRGRPLIGSSWANYSMRMIDIPLNGCVAKSGLASNNLWSMRCSMVSEIMQLLSMHSICIESSSCKSEQLHCLGDEQALWQLHQSVYGGASHKESCHASGAAFFWSWGHTPPWHAGGHTSGRMTFHSQHIQRYVTAAGPCLQGHSPGTMR